MSTSFFPWFNRVRRAFRKGQASRRRHARPELEVLEDRTAPAVFMVNTTVDAPALDPTMSAAIDGGGDISLRSAVQRVDFLGGTNTIMLPAGFYRLTDAGPGGSTASTGHLDINNLGTNTAPFDLMIEGGGASTTIIDGNPNTSPGGPLTPDRVFETYDGTTVTISGVTIQNGVASDSGIVNFSLGTALGGGILNLGALTINNCIIQDNEAVGQNDMQEQGFVTGGFAAGGGIYNGSTGSLIVTTSSFLSNQAIGGAADASSEDNAFAGEGFGGGIYNQGTFSVNPGVVQVSDTTFDSNKAIGGNAFSADGAAIAGDGGGGGFYTENGTVTLLRNTFSNNTVQGGTATSTTGDNPEGGNAQGGGLFSSGDTLLVENCTYYANIVTSGGSSGEAGGSAGVAQGGGIFIGNNEEEEIVIGNNDEADVAVAPVGVPFPGDNDGEVINTTLTLNQANGGNADYGGDASGGGIFVEGGITLDLGSTLVAANTVTAGTGPAGDGNPTGPDVDGDFDSLTHNLIGTGDGSTGLTNNMNNDQVGGLGNPVINADLLPLAKNGGPTMTVALDIDAVSPAIDQGTTFPQTDNTDQRGTGFDRVVGPAADVGAYEVQDGSLAGFVYEDNNDNGIFEPGLGETGIQNVTVTLTGTDFLGNTVDIPMMTDSTGAYDFPDLRPSNASGYTITETHPTGFIDGKDTQGTPGNGTTSQDQFSGIVLAPSVNGQNNNFGELLPATVSGFVYEDLNNNGLRAGSGEPGISGVTVVLTGTNDQGTIAPETTTTAADGSYSFANLRPGTYVVTDTPPSGFLDGLLTRGNVTPITGSVGTHDINAITVTSGGTAVENDFAELPPAIVSGFVYQDLNNNGLRASSGEPGISGVTVVLTGTNDLGAIMSQTTTTAANGSYSFGNLRPGTYTVTDTPPSGFLDGLLTRGNVTPIAGSVGTHDINAITVTSGGTAVENDFAELPPAIVSGFVYQDLNNNGLRASTGEPGIPGVTVVLTGTNDQGTITPETTTTAANGSYSFDNLRPGTYIVTDTPPSGFLDGLLTRGNVTPIAGSVGTHDINSITVAVGGTAAENDFAELPPGTVSGFVYQDLNNNGLRASSGEPGIPGVTVVLTGTDDQGTITPETTTTAANGSYSFGNLRPGTYTVTDTPPSGFLDGLLTRGNVTPIAGSVGTHDIGSITVAVGGTAAENDFAELPPATVSGFVYQDLNDNGLRASTGEPGIPGVTVVLTGTNDQGTITPETTTTAANGSYSFGNLRPGTYTVTDTPPSGFLDGLLTRGNVTPITGSVGTHDINAITVTSGGTAVENDFAELPPAIVSGFVYQDLNNNGLRASTGEPGIPGVTVVLTGTNDQGTITPETTTTAANGSYSFGNLRPGTYTVTDTPPSGFLDGLLTRGNVTPIAGSVGTHDINSITVAVGGTAAENDFAELPPATVSGFVYQDLNDNGLRASTGEPGIPGVTVVLTGTNDQGTITPETTTTAANGSYSFGNLRPGTYTVTDTPPSGFLDGLLTRGNVTPITGSVGTHDINSITVAAGATAPENDFAELPPAIVSGFVYQDLNDNGLRASTGEPGIPGVTVVLTGTNDQGTITPETTTTAANGSYSFGNLRPGTYTVTDTPPSGFLDGLLTRGNVTPIAGSVGTHDIGSITVAAGGTAAENDFAELPPAIVSGFVYQDLNDNGLRASSGEPGIPGVTVVLTGTNDLGAIMSQTTTTAANGSYSFGDLRPGTYTVTDTPPTGFLDGLLTRGNVTPIAGSVGTHDIGSITVAVGGTAAENDFAELPPATVSGFVYQDLNDNGLRASTGEPGIPGVTVVLTGTNDLGAIMSQTTTTAANGSYSFGNLRPGTYTVTDTPPSGFLDGLLTRGNVTPIAGSVGTHDIGSITVAAGATAAENDFAELPPAIVSGFVYQDLNDNGLRASTGEPGISGVTVVLTGTNDLGTITSQTMTTGQDGSYSFDNLRPGTYTVTEPTQPTGFVAGLKTMGNVTPIAGSAAIDDINNITVATGGTAVENDFGELIEANSSISGVVFVDANNDGVQQAGEPGLAGVTVTLTGSNAQGVINPMTVTTAANGSYSFTKLQAGTYTVTETPPVGFFQGKEILGTITGGTGSAGTIGANSYQQIVLNSGAVGKSFNFAELKPSTLAGSVYADVNGNRLRDAAERGLPGVTVTLVGTDDQGSAVDLSVVTDAKGDFQFQVMRAGTYSLIMSAPKGFIDNELPRAGSLGGVVTMDHISSIAESFNQSGVNNLFGLRGLAAVSKQLFLASTNLNALLPGPAGTGTAAVNSVVDPSGYVYVDANHNGVRDPGEKGLAGVEVTLVGMSKLGKAVSFTAVTDSTGFYRIATAPPGVYTLTVTPPTGFVSSSATVGSLGGKKAGPSSIASIVLIADALGTGYDFGEILAPGKR